MLSINESQSPVYIKPRRFSTTTFLFGKTKLHWPLTIVLPSTVKKCEDGSNEKISTSSSESERRITTLNAKEHEDVANEKAQRRRLREKELLLRRLDSDMMAAKVETDFQRSKYGASSRGNVITEVLPEGSALDNNHYQIPMDNLHSQLDTTVSFKVRLYDMRRLSSNLVFFLLRHQCTTLQGILRADGQGITRHMVRWAQRIPLESIIQVTGTLQRPNDPIRSASIKDVEIVISALFVINQPIQSLAFNLNTASDQHALALRMSNRTLDLRCLSSQAIFRIQSAVCRQFRTFLDNENFIEIHTPKLIGGASESGASVFNVDYFGRKACLAQSPQLFKQMCINSDFKRVYEIGPVFRAENSNTHRHLTEYTGLDLEMELENDDYREIITLVDTLLKSIFEALFARNRSDLDTVKRGFPHSDLVWLESTPILSFQDGINMLVDSGYVEEDGSVPLVNEDLTTKAEMKLGALVKERYKTDYYVLDKFPLKVRPFYTMPDSNLHGSSNSFDVFIRGQEIISGSQRIHQSEQLEENISRLHMEKKGLEEYLESFRLAAPSHGGCGIGLERFVMLFLGLNDIRNASLFPRDPKSFKNEAVKSSKIRHPEASTDVKARSKQNNAEAVQDCQLEKLIANYGDSSNTSWLDDRFLLWRDTDSGAIIGYVPLVESNRVIVVGDPLCQIDQSSRMIKMFLVDMQKQKKVVIWLLVSSHVEAILSHQHQWNSLSCVAESRIPGHHRIESNKDLQAKLRLVSKAGLKTVQYSLHDIIPAQVKSEVDSKIQLWIQNRKGKQVHLTNIRPWQDEEHRVYYIVYDTKSTICALVVLAQLSIQNGYQIKWALDFPGAPNGAIEYAIDQAIKSNSGVSLTFGASAVSNMIIGKNIKSVKGKALQSTYSKLAKNLSLMNKVEFRKKFGSIQEDRLWICFPKKSMGPSTIKAIISFFGAE